MEALAGTGQAVSGEALGAALGMTRVAVWKQVRALSEAGVPIRSTSRGYLLENLPDRLEGWNFPEVDIPLRHFPVCASTMEQARTLFRVLDLPYAVTANRQTAGEDHSWGEWDSPEGGIYLTLVIPSVFPWSKAHLYNTAGTELVGDILSRMTGLSFRKERPARLYSGKSCVAGVMTELYGPFDAPWAAAVGIGIRVNRTIPRGPETLADLLGHPLSRREILAALLNGLLEKLITE